MNNQLDQNSLSNAIVSTATLIKVFSIRCFMKNDFEITPEQFIILDAAAKNKEIYQRQLGEILGKDRANIARLVNILEKKGLIKKVADLTGRHVNRIITTEEGMKVRNKIYPIISEIRESYLNNIDLNELQKCLVIINKIKENIAKNTKLKI